MSVVSNVILAFSILEHDGDRIADVNEYFETDDRRGFIIPAGEHQSCWYGGSKALEHPTFVGAFNYLNHEEFIKHVAAVAWDYPDEVQVFICGQEEEIYRLRYGVTEERMF